MSTKIFYDLTNDFTWINMITEIRIFKDFKSNIKTFYWFVEGWSNAIFLFSDLNETSTLRWSLLTPIINSIVFVNCKEATFNMVSILV